MNTTFDRLKTILARDYKVDPQALTPTSSLESLNMELLWTMEEEFGIKLPAEPVDLPDIAAVVRYIDGLVAAQIAGANVSAGGGMASVTRKP
jgi:acyl carrier protein